MLQGISSYWSESHKSYDTIQALHCWQKLIADYNVLILLK